MKKQRRDEAGYTLLELLVTLGIIVILIAVVSPDFSEFDDKKRFENALGDLTNELSTMRTEALTRNTSTRVELAVSGADYTLTTYAAPLASSTCNPAGSWVVLYSKELDVPSEFEVTGNGVGDVCFYRDGSASGGQYNFDQIDGGTDIGSAMVNVTIATGYIDVVKN